MDAALEDTWWARLAEQVTVEAESRGGRAVGESDYVVRLDAPADSRGESIHLTRYDDGLCKLEVGFFASFMASFVEFDDQNGILGYVVAVLDGHASEAVDVTYDGEWVGVGAMIEQVQGDGTTRTARSRRPAPGQANALPAAHTFSRRIIGWGGLRFLDGGSAEQ